MNEEACAVLRVCGSEVFWYEDLYGLLNKFVASVAEQIQNLGVDGLNTAVLICNQSGVGQQFKPSFGGQGGA